MTFEHVLLAALLLVGMTVSVSRADDPKPGEQVAQQTTVTTSNGEITVRYWLYLPEDYSADTKYPFVLFLHGAGERGTDMELVKVWGPPLQVKEGKDFPFILVSPQCPADQYWDIEALDQLVQRLSSDLPIDPRRRYVTGLSMGGFGTWRLLARNPQLFAAAVPVCGGGDVVDAGKLVEIPIWAFHGDQDQAVLLEESQKMVDAVKKAGGTKVKLTVYEGVGHNSWSPTYDNPEVYEWLLSHQKSAE